LASSTNFTQTNTEQTIKFLLLVQRFTIIFLFHHFAPFRPRNASEATDISLPVTSPVERYFSDAIACQQFVNHSVFGVGLSLGRKYSLLFPIATSGRFRSL
jgi:hypothetical protein